MRIRGINKNERNEREWVELMRMRGINENERNEWEWEEWIEWVEWAEWMRMKWVRGNEMR